MNQNIARFEKMVAQYPDNELARFSLAKAYFDAGNFTHARHHFALALEKKPDWMVAQILFGKCAQAMGDIPAAKSSFEKAHALAIAQHHEGPQAEMEALLGELA